MQQRHRDSISKPQASGLQHHGQTSGGLQAPSAGNLLSPMAAMGDMGRRKSTLSGNGFFIDYSCSRRRSSAATKELQQQAAVRTQLMRYCVSPVRSAAAPRPSVQLRGSQQSLNGSPSHAPPTLTHRASISPTRMMGSGGGAALMLPLGHSSAAAMAGSRKTSIFDPQGHSLQAAAGATSAMLRRKSTMTGNSSPQVHLPMAPVVSSTLSSVAKQAARGGSCKRQGLVQHVPVIGCSPTSIEASLAALDETRRYEKLIQKLHRRKERRQRHKLRHLQTSDSNLVAREPADEHADENRFKLRRSFRQRSLRNIKRALNRATSGSFRQKRRNSSTSSSNEALDEHCLSVSSLSFDSACSSLPSIERLDLLCLSSSGPKEMDNLWTEHHGDGIESQPRGRGSKSTSGSKSLVKSTLHKLAASISNRSKQQSADHTSGHKLARRRSISVSGNLNYWYYYYYLHENSVDQVDELPIGASAIGGRQGDSNFVPMVDVASSRGPSDEQHRKSRLFVNYSLARLEILNSTSDPVAKFSNFLRRTELGEAVSECPSTDDSLILSSSSSFSSSDSTCSSSSDSASSGATADESNGRSSSQEPDGSNLTQSSGSEVRCRGRHRHPSDGSSAPECRLSAGLASPSIELQPPMPNKSSSVLSCVSTGARDQDQATDSSHKRLSYNDLARPGAYSDLRSSNFKVQTQGELASDDEELDDFERLSRCHRGYKVSAEPTRTSARTSKSLITEPRADSSGSAGRLGVTRHRASGRSLRHRASQRKAPPPRPSLSWDSLDRRPADHGPDRLGQANSTAPDYLTGNDLTSRARGQPDKARRELGGEGNYGNKRDNDCHWRRHDGKCCQALHLNGPSTTTNELHGKLERYYCSYCNCDELASDAIASENDNERLALRPVHLEHGDGQARGHEDPQRGERTRESTSRSEHWTGPRSAGDRRTEQWRQRPQLVGGQTRDGGELASWRSPASQADAINASSFGRSSSNHGLQVPPPGARWSSWSSLSADRPRARPTEPSSSCPVRGAPAQRPPRSRTPEGRGARVQLPSIQTGELLAARQRGVSE